MDEEIFKMKTVGKVGKRRVGPEYMMKIEERASVLRGLLNRKQKQGSEKQLKLPGMPGTVKLKTEQE